MQKATEFDTRTRAQRKIYPPMEAGQKYGMLTTIERVGRDKHHNITWNFRCDCGRTVVLAAYIAKRALQRSCGCLKNKHAYRPLKCGDRFGFLMAIRPAEEPERRSTPWVFRCDCGQEVERKPWPVKAGTTKSCGCYHADAPRIHGGTGTPEYRSWMAMRRRCHDPNNIGYPNYGGRGIRVCDRWDASFAAFVSDMGPRPPGTTLDRWPDANGNYEPGNCRWATPAVQRRNTRQVRLVRFDGRDLCLKDAAAEAGLPYCVVQQRLNRGWSLNAALTKPKEPRRARAA